MNYYSHVNGCNLGTISCSSNGSLIDETVACGCGEEQFVLIKGTCSRQKIENLLKPGEMTWTQIFIPEVLCLPEQKPDIEELMSVTSVPEIIAQHVIKTPVLVSCEDEPIPIENQEGTFLTGRKLIIEGLLKQKIIYTAAVPEQSIHSSHFDVPFSAFIILPPDTPLTQKFKVEICIEDIFVCRVTPRQVFKNVTVFIKATALVCQSGC
jgi:hypothetical protein